MSGWGMRVTRGGVVERDPFTNMGRIIGRVNTNGANGSVTDDGLLTGTPEWQVVLLSTPSAAAAAPTISVSGNTLSWEYPSGASWPAVIVYWVR